MGLQIAKESKEDRLMTLSMGSQHPGAGHFRFTIKVDGDYVVYCDPDSGYVHRDDEKMCEYLNIIQNIPQKIYSRIERRESLNKCTDTNIPK